MRRIQNTGVVEQHRTGAPSKRFETGAAHVARRLAMKIARKGVKRTANNVPEGIRQANDLGITDQILHAPKTFTFTTPGAVLPVNRKG
jgi:hypothetical protein